MPTEAAGDSGAAKADFNLPTPHFSATTTRHRLQELHQSLQPENAELCIHTATQGPCILDVAIEFADERRTLAFERYLKSGSGGAFAQRHLR